MQSKLKPATTLEIRQTSSNTNIEREAGTSSDDTSKGTRLEGQPIDIHKATNRIPTINKAITPINITQGNKSTTGLASIRGKQGQVTRTTGTVR
jgi:hypothetical protein